MADWAPANGGTLLVPSGSVNHLFAMVLGPIVIEGYGKSEQVVLVNATSIPDGAAPYDATCVLVPGDHPFIKHPSYIAYRHMRIESSPHLCACVGKSVFVPHDPCSADLLARVVDGVCKSRMTPREFKRIFGCA